MLWYSIYFEMSAVNTTSWIIFANWRFPQTVWNVHGASKYVGENTFWKTYHTNMQLILIHY